MIILGSSRTLTASATSETFDEAVLALSPTAYWKLDESSGTTADDAMNLVDGAYTGTFTLGESSLSADGLGTSFGATGAGCVVVANNAAITCGSAFTFFCLLKQSSSAAIREVFAKGKTDVSGQQGMYLESLTTTRELKLVHFNGSWHNLSTGLYLPDNTTCAFAFRYNGGTSASFFIDGTKTDKTLGAAILSSNQPLYIGGVWYVSIIQQWYGQMESVAWFNSAKSDGDLATLFDYTPPE